MFSFKVLYHFILCEFVNFRYPDYFCHIFLFSGWMPMHWYCCYSWNAMSAIILFSHVSHLIIISTKATMFSCHHCRLSLEMCALCCICHHNNQENYNFTSLSSSYMQQAQQQCKLISVTSRNAVDVDDYNVTGDRTQEAMYIYGPGGGIVALAAQKRRKTHIHNFIYDDNFCKFVYQLSCQMTWQRER